MCKKKEKRIDKLISDGVDIAFSGYKGTKKASAKVRNEAINALKAQWRSEVKAEIIEELTAEEIALKTKEVNSRMQSQKAKKAIEDLRLLVIEGIFLAVIVGVLVNQITDIVTYMKGDKAYLITFAVIAVLIVIIFFYVIVRLITSISKLLNTEGASNETDS